MTCRVKRVFLPELPLKLHLFVVVVFLTLTVTEKNFLESETGLKIVQTGVGEVLDTHIYLSPLH